ncbi:hypothetical protein B3_38 [Propionibacterium phage B3]|uniref:Uncharacterized protein n=1 Tax=Propionibacterium phage B3 TaxID=1897533 RepID=A0A1D8ETF3_9CAUD|nr:hypothetical protein FDH09_gp38 [Propionibacterium phage B3]AOT24331.1 hypothetical protein B3_38 [Propionibacterium phage B3]
MSTLPAEAAERWRQWDELARTILGLHLGLTDLEMFELVGAIIGAGWHRDGAVES